MIQAFIFTFFLIERKDWKIKKILFGSFQHFLILFQVLITKSPSPQLLKITKSPIFLGTNHQITNKKIAKSPSPQLFKITKSPIFSGTNHQITNKKVAKSPSPQLLKITKSPIFICTNHQITNKKIA